MDNKSMNVIKFGHTKLIDLFELFVKLRTYREKNLVLQTGKQTDLNGKLIDLSNVEIIDPEHLMIDPTW